MKSCSFENGIHFTFLGGKVSEKDIISLIISKIISRRFAFSVVVSTFVHQYFFLFNHRILMQPRVKTNVRKNNKKNNMAISNSEDIKKKERDELYIRFLLNNNENNENPESCQTPPLSEKIGGSLTSRLSSKPSVYSVGKRPSTAKLPNTLLGTFPMISNQTSVRKYVKPIRELHVPPSIIFMEEKIGQMHMTDILELDQQVLSAVTGVSEVWTRKASTKNSLKGFNFIDDEDETQSEVSSRASLSIPNNQLDLPITSPFPHFKSQHNASTENNSSNHSKSLHLTQTSRSGVGGSFSLKRANTTPSSSRSVPVSSAGTSRARSKPIARPGDSVHFGALKPPSLDMFFKPVVHPDGVFSTPTLDLAELPTAKSSVHTFLGSLREKF